MFYVVVPLAGQLFVLRFFTAKRLHSTAHRSRRTLGDRPDSPPNAKGVSQMEMSHAAIACSTHVHLVFSTKLREPFLRDTELRGRLHAFLAGACRNLDSPSLISSKMRVTSLMEQLARM